VIQPTVDILQSLKEAGYPLYGLSNWSAEKFQLVRHKYEFFDWFEAILVSGEVKLIKPDPRVYILFLNKIGRAAGECLYIDDSAANVATAVQLGFATIQYESSLQLETALRQMGLI
jgi:2-haloacid dehalogenase